MIVFLSIGAVSIFIATRITAGQAVSVSDPDPLLLGGLAAGGLRFESDPTLSTSVTADEALQYAVDEYGGNVSDAVVYLGLLTEEDRGDISVDRPVYAVSVTGLAIARMGAPTPPDQMHGEWVVFVDAATGEEILATTFR